MFRRRLWLALALGATACARPGARPDVVLISVDTLRADRLSAARQGPAGPPTTPHVDAWARDHATVFRQAVAAAPWTLPSHASLLTGLDPLRHATNRAYRALPEELPTLAERLRARGYFTAALVGGGWLDPAYGLQRGFQRWRTWPRARNGREEWEQHASAALAWLEALPRPFFLFIHTYDVHDFPRAPHLPANVTDAERARLYDAAVAHMDAHLAPLLARLATPARRATTAVVLTSDHGEALGEPLPDGQRDYGHGSLREAVLRVPLVVSLPQGSASAARPAFVDAQARSLDVAATLLELCGARPLEPSGEPALDGVSLLPLLRGEPRPPRPALSYFARPGFGLALRDGRGFKFTFADAALAPDDARSALFDLARDPAELRDLAATAPQAAGRGREHLRRLVARRAVGLALTLRAGPAPVTVALRGALLRLGTPTSPQGVILRAGAGDAATLALPAGQARALLFQPTAESRVEVLVDGRVTTVDWRRETTSLALDDGGWRAGGSPTGPCAARLCLGAVRRGVSERGLRAAPVLADPALAERLRALGYLQ